MQTIKKTFEAMKVDQQPWKEKLCDQLGNFRASPHMSTAHCQQERRSTGQCTPRHHKLRLHSLPMKEHSQRGANCQA